MKFFKDLLAGPNNEYWDLGRILALLSSLGLVAGAGWNVMLGLPLELGPTGFGGGFAAVLTAAAALIYAKDRARTESASTAASFMAPPAPAPAAAATVAGKCPPKRPTKAKKPVAKRRK